MSDSERTLLRRRKIGFVFQRFNLLPGLSARGNIVLAQQIQGDGFDPHRFDVTVNLLGLRDRLNHKPAALSGGEQQRVAIARAVITEPKILLADEPTGNLDEKATRAVVQLLRDINASGTSVVMATHDAALVRESNFRTLEMKQGRLVSDSARGAGEDLA